MRVLKHVDLNPGRLRTAYDKVVAAIERDDFRSADVKKLGDGPYYRAKLDYESRLLLRFGKFEGSTVAFAVELIPGHAYERSRFLRGAAFDETRIETSPAVAAPDPSGADVEPLRYLHPSRARFHFLDRLLSFDDAQDEVYRLKPPALVVGAAGSGKTVLLLEKMRTLEGEVAYVTQSAFLAESARALYRSHGFDREEQTADFLSFREYLESIRVPHGRPVTFRDFAAWFERHRATFRFTDAHRTFEEFRGVIGAQPEGVRELDPYLALGVKQSIFTPDERRALHGLFKRYRAWLEESGLFDTNLVAHEYLRGLEPRFDWVVIDEAQDLTNAELALILRAVRTPGHFVLTGDANQIVHPNFFSWSQVKSLFYRDESLGREQEIAVLAANYRNSRAVTATANALLKVKHARFGSIDRESNHLVRAASAEDGSVVGFPATDAVIADLANKIRTSTRCAVIVLRDEQKGEARRRLRTPLVFSIHEAKGLEYESVVLFQLVSTEPDAYREIGEGVDAADLAREDLDYRRARDKGDKSLEVYKFFANALYVAITRAIQNVYLVESDLDHPLLDLIGIHFHDDARDVRTQRSSVEDWQAEARKLELQGKAEQAEAIRSTVLHTTPVPWPVMDAAAYQETCTKAFAPGSVFTKAKASLFDYAAMHHVKRLAQRLARDAGFAPAKAYESHRRAIWERTLAPYQKKNLRDILDQTDRYGVEFPSPAGLTPLMLATAAGNVALIDALLARGADRAKVDPFGRAAMHWAIHRAYENDAYARGPFGEAYDRVALTAIDVQVDGRLFKLGRERAEHFFLSAMIVLFPRLLGARQGRFNGFTARMFDEGSFAAFPATVIPEKRKKRPYVNSVLARNELESTYTPSRKLWRRERHGEYVPNPDLLLRYGSGETAGEWRPILELLGVARYDEHLSDGAWTERDRILAERRSSPVDSG